MCPHISHILDMYILRYYAGRQFKKISHFIINMLHIFPLRCGPWTYGYLSEWPLSHPKLSSPDIHNTSGDLVNSSLLER